MKRIPKRSEIKAYLQGTNRALLLQTWLFFLVPRYIREQYKYRIKAAKAECHKQGKCIGCGCKMPAVLLANKACKMGCYPYMLNKKKWAEFKLTTAYHKTMTS